MAGLRRSCVSEEGETVDRLVWRVFGRQDGRLVELTLDLNPGLAAAGPILAGGRRVLLPDEPAVPEQPLVRLWD